MISSTIKQYTFYLSVCSLLFVSCNNDRKNQPQQIEEAAAQESKPQTFTLQKDTVITSITLPGELLGFREVELHAKVSSYVKSLKVDIGSEVKAGQLLVELEAPEIQSQLEAARSRLHSQEAVYTASNSTYQRLLETSKVEGTISTNDLEQALARKNADHAQLEAAGATEKEVQTMQSYLQIRAPFAGKVTARNINVGAYVGQGSQVPLLSVQDQEKLRLTLSVPEAYTGYLKSGDELGFRVVSLRGETFSAKISRMSGALDRTLRSERVELDVDNSDHKLLPGMVAEVSLPIKSRNNPFVVPKTAVMTTSEGIFVIRIVDNKVQRIKVEPGLDASEKIEIFSNQLQENDTLLVKADEEFRNGDDFNQ